MRSMADHLFYRVPFLSQVVEAIGRASVDDQAATPTVDVRALLTPAIDPIDAGSPH